MKDKLKEKKKNKMQIGCINTQFICGDKSKKKMKTQTFIKYNGNMRNNGNIVRQTYHSSLRTAQRGIRNSWIAAVVREGRVIHKQGYMFFYMTDRELCYHKPDMQDKLRNLVVVVAGDSNRVVTCYKNRNGVKRIKRKSKRLITN